MPRKHHWLRWLFVISLVFCMGIHENFLLHPLTDLIAKTNVELQANVSSAQNPQSKLVKEHERENCQQPMYSQFETQGNSLNYYRQSITEKLNSWTDNVTNRHQRYLDYVITEIDKLPMIEIYNYHDSCRLSLINNQAIDFSLLKSNAAVFYSFILEQKTAIIARFPRSNQRLKLHWINLNSQALREEINDFRKGLEDYSEITYNLQPAQQLYNQIIRPFENDLESLKINTLVFIQDGMLRSIPMAALYDGEKFLIEKYAIAITPSLSLTNLQTSQHKKTRALAVGLTQDAIVDGHRYKALSNVAAEIREVKKLIPGSKQLLDENFTRDRLKSELSESFYPIIHIATHGEFGQYPNETFLVTGDHQKLTITELDKILRSLNYSHKTADLLLLTACESAIGDDRAALGLAGVAVQAGVKTALASLWSINDASTVKLATKFYQAWYHFGVSKAEALQIAQRSLIADDGVSSHPAHWAAFILVGNWL